MLTTFDPTAGCPTWCDYRGDHRCQIDAVFPDLDSVRWHQHQVAPGVVVEMLESPGPVGFSEPAISAGEDLDLDALDDMSPEQAESLASALLAAVAFLRSLPLVPVTT